MKAIVGLGNPGKKYETTRHNVGFLFLDWLLQKHDQEPSWKKKFSGKAMDLQYGSESIRLLKPETYMNRSGTSVQKLLSYYKIDPSECLIISDDVDMEFGKIRMREKGSSGGHNGLSDIFQKLGSTDVARIKIGIGRHEHMDTADWVLSGFTSTELQILADDIFPKVYSLVEELL